MRQETSKGFLLEGTIQQWEVERWRGRQRREAHGHRMLLCGNSTRGSNNNTLQLVTNACTLHKAAQKGPVPRKQV